IDNSDVTVNIDETIATFQFNETNAVINTVETEVTNEFITNGGDAIAAGPYVRVETPDSTLTLAGNELTGAFAFEQYNDSNGNSLLKVGAVNINLENNPQGKLVNGRGGFV
ncbi:MAG TPA: hypothetical protein DHW38_15025, partial [Planctomycetaceae bacterium]|nr:hypothetical protein [Planctomycetaceae bacterium]